MITRNLNETVASKRRIYFIALWASERQKVDLGDIGTGDTFTLTFMGQTTGSISFAADMASAIDTALEALSNIEAGDITVEKAAGSHIYYVMIGGSRRHESNGLISITPTGFTPVGVSRVGEASSPATDLTFAAADIQISKNGGTFANSAGTVTEVADGSSNKYGLYYYTATQTEFNTPGSFILTLAKAQLAATFFEVTISPNVLRSGVAQDGTTSSIRLDSNASAVSNAYTPCLVVITAGTGVGQGPRFMVSYDGVGKWATIAPNWTTVPDSTSEFELHPTLPMALASDVIDEIENNVKSSLLSDSSAKINVNANGEVKIQKTRTV